MPNLAAALKTEIARIARKELRGDLDALKKASTGYRREIATLKKRNADLERLLKRAAKAVPRGPVKPGDTGSEDRQLRFSPARLASQRKKLGLSAANFAKLIGVSGLSVYKWENGQTRPRRAQLEAIAAVRGIGKREAQERLEQLAG
ncbi:helix-turn-helix domain-containing protein [Ramlibacter sp. XY19]|uniref:helix-turn-helix domain-containing protein n=1 Tax=Ramlibacter paludis TaxID=2908000 RepID=UPI0023DB6A79|nr:helix-turn-helix domain-containing protein [Ramlibacter paludis]MCG2593021.1 helix-turn-helix domain-containing protein [Ramlibacter paludis]